MVDNNLKEKSKPKEPKEDLSDFSMKLGQWEIIIKDMYANEDIGYAKTCADAVFKALLNHNALNDDVELLKKFVYQLCKLKISSISVIGRNATVTVAKGDEEEKPNIVIEGRKIGEKWYERIAALVMRGEMDKIRQLVGNFELIPPKDGGNTYLIKCI